MSEPWRETTLPNGLRVITESMPRLQTASFGVWVDVGTRHEDAAVNGVAHMLEHMAFKGTERRSARGIAEEIERVGGSLNAYTSRDNTAYYARILADDLPLAADILADILQHSTFDETELEKERHVILQEIGQVLDTPDDLVFDQFQETAYPDQPMGRSILGPAEVVEALPRHALTDYMTRHYAPSRIVVSAAGKVDHDQVVDLAGSLFTSLSGGESVPEPARYEGGLRIEHCADLEQVHLCVGVEAVPFTDPDFWPLQVFSTAWGGGMSSRLFQEIRENRGLCYSIYSFTSAHADTGTLGVYAGTGADDLEELLPVLVEETRKLILAPDADEVLRAKAQLKAGLFMALESCQAVCEEQARQLFCFGRRIPTEEIVARLEAVDIDAIRTVGKRLFGKGRTSVTAIGPIERLPEITLSGLV
ncbi:MAG: pitrilysin family protein [Geminicoccaceae bacterium]